MKTRKNVWANSLKSLFFLGLFYLMCPQMNAQEVDPDGIPEIRECVVIVINGDNNTINMIHGDDNDVNTGNDEKGGVLGALEDVFEWLKGLFDGKGGKGGGDDDDDDDDDDDGNDNGGSGSNSGGSGSEGSEAAKFLGELPVVDVRADARGILLKLAPASDQCLRMTFKGTVPVPAFIIRKAKLTGKHYFAAGSYRSNKQGVIRIPFR